MTRPRQPADEHTVECVEGDWPACVCRPKLSDDARLAIAKKLGHDYWPVAELNAAHALAATMPDGRTIAQHLDDGAAAIRVLRALRPERIDVDGSHLVTSHHADRIDTDAADLLARLEADR